MSPVLATPALALSDDAPHLLVVDDDRRIRDLLSRFLLAEGYRVDVHPAVTWCPQSMTAFLPTPTSGRISGGSRQRG